MQESLIKRFLEYVRTNTMANEDSTSFPSTRQQIEFARKLVEECKAIGLVDVTLDENGYVMATLPSNISKKTPIVGFIAHMDTVPDYPGDHVNPQIIENYQGGSIILNKEQGIELSPSQFPVLDSLIKLR